MFKAYRQAFPLVAAGIFLLFSPIGFAERYHAKIAIIIDDIGNNTTLGERAAKLPGAITYGILPFTPAAKKLSFYATHMDKRKEIIVHMPMEASHQRELGEGGLYADYDRQEFLNQLALALDELPLAKGLSNHMGSHLTTMPDRMDWLMDELDRRGLYFIDSKTTRHSAAEQAAQNSDVPYMARDIFLDHDPSIEAIELAFEQAVRTAKQTGLAIVIAHPYRSTLTFLEAHLPHIASSGIELINASEALKLQTRLQTLAVSDVETKP